MIHLTIDGQAISVPKGTTVYEAAKQLGIEIPIFCYHDRMPPFGACRVCMVQVESMPKPQTSCTLVATDGMVIQTEAQLAKDSRQAILELLLINHPLDCPICDRGGECPLQDQTLKFGPDKSRFFEDKRRFKKPIALTPVLTLDRERCIVCARCTRFSDLIAGDHALEFADRGFKTEVVTAKEKVAEPKFLGNTIMICPVGALTSTAYRFRARPWDNTPTPTTCPLCPVGCSMILDSRDGEIVRTRSLENSDVNDIWLCDKGWFGYEFVDHPQRLHTPLLKKNGVFSEVTWEEAISFAAEKFKSFKENKKIAAFGGNNLTIEESYLLQKLMREGAEVNHVDHRIGMPIFNLEMEALFPGMEMPIAECKNLDYAIFLGTDITEEFPVLWLHFKQIMPKGKIIFIGHYAPEVASQLSEVFLHAPGGELNAIQQFEKTFRELVDQEKKGALFVGRQYLATTHRREILQALLALKNRSPNLSLNLLEGKGNSMGARFAGMHPELLPKFEKAKNAGMNALEVLNHASNDGWDLLYTVGSNPAAHCPSGLWEKARSQMKCLIVQDLFMTKTAESADLVLPTLCYAEKTGHFANIEGRVQTLMPGKVIPEHLYGDGEIISLIGWELGLDLYCDESFLLALQQIRLPIERPKTLSLVSKDPILPSSFLSASFAPKLFDHGTRMLHNNSLIKQALCRGVFIHPLEGSKRALKEGGIVRLSFEKHSITAPIYFDEKVAPMTIVLPLGFDKVPSHELAPNLLNGLTITLEQ